MRHVEKRVHTIQRKNDRAAQCETERENENVEKRKNILLITDYSYEGHLELALDVEELHNGAEEDHAQKHHVKQV